MRRRPLYHTDREASRIISLPLSGMSEAERVRIRYECNLPLLQPTFRPTLGRLGTRDRQREVLGMLFLHQVWGKSHACATFNGGHGILV